MGDPLRDLVYAALETCPTDHIVTKAAAGDVADHIAAALADLRCRCCQGRCACGGRRLGVSP